jgi:hypothetical protein
VYVAVLLTKSKQPIDNSSGWNTPDEAFRGSRRDFLKKTGAWAGAGISQPLFNLVGAGKSIAAAYPEEVLSIEKFIRGKIKPGMIISRDTADLVKDISPEGVFLELQRGAQIKIAETNCVRRDHSALLPVNPMRLSFHSIFYRKSKRSSYGQTQAKQ